MAKVENIKIYNKARTCKGNEFAGRCATANWRAIYTQLFRMGWRAQMIKYDSAVNPAPRYVEFLANRIDNEQNNND